MNILEQFSAHQGIQQNSKSPPPTPMMNTTHLHMQVDLLCERVQSITSLILGNDHLGQISDKTAQVKQIFSDGFLPRIEEASSRNLENLKNANSVLNRLEQYFK